MTAAGRAEIGKIVTSGTFSLDGGTWDVDNNVWIIGDETECVVVDAPHDAGAIAAAVGDRQVRGILLTHAHDDHVDAAVELAGLVDAPILLHADDRELWDRTHPTRRPDETVTDGQLFDVAGLTLQALHTPGHTWGSVCYLASDLGAVFTGDTLFAGGPGATGRSYSDFPTIVTSIRTRLLTLPPATAVHTGHGDDTTIGAEAPHVQEWLDRGH
ncbi:MBL fold metallo-hydrolase [Jatrophihabitans sp. YIM 134969]